MSKADTKENKKQKLKKLKKIALVVVVNACIALTVMIARLTTSKLLQLQ